LIFSDQNNGVAVTGNLPVVREKPKWLRKRLRHKQAIKRIGMRHESVYRAELSLFPAGE
jgi:hypothetical protein